jgi:hypothetical protein
MNMDPVIQSFKPNFIDLARRAKQGDPTVVGCLMGYTGHNPTIADDLLALYDQCVQEVAKELTEVAA